MYESKHDDYYKHVRSEILPFLPDRMERVLEIGCGTGNTLSWIQKIKKCDFVCGVELFAESAEIARERVNMVVQGDIEQLELPSEFNSFDAILCLDVLEHLVDPWGLINRLHKLLNPGGVLIASIPNVRYWGVVLPLIFKGEWEYQQEGTLDRTHLRFFCKSSAINLMQSSGLKLDKIRSTGLEVGRKAWYLNLLTLTIFRPFFEFQYLIRVQKNI